MLMTITNIFYAILQQIRLLVSIRLSVYDLDGV